MLVLVRRPTASVCIALALSIVACAHIERKEAQAVIQPSGGSGPMEKIVGVTLKDGRGIRFNKHSRAVVRGDSLQAQVGYQPVAIPVSDLRQVWVQTISKTKTMLLAIAGLVVVGMISSLASDQGGF